MGLYDGAEVCELIGLFLLDKLSHLLGKECVGLYRDDGLAIIRNANGPMMDRIRKDVIALFKNEGLSITIETNLIETDFLDVTFNLTTKKYFPFRKPDNKPLYINVHSNHPPTIIQQLPEMINKRISDISCDREEFDNAKGVYEAALRESGYNPAMTYQPQQQNPPRNRNRKVIWFNPPFSQSIKTNIGKSFLKLIKKHFTKQHRYHKIFNTNTLKLSYCCMGSIGNTIKQHNSRVLNKLPENDEKKCNCRVKENCPMNGECLVKHIVYKAIVSDGNQKSTYYGTSESEFKTRYNNHTKSFRHKKHKNDTELSKLIWKLKENGTPYALAWSVAARASPYRCGSRRCDLCLTEKMIIVWAEPKGLLNKRTELISKCRHRNKYTLNNLK